jgi:hypothetical protein
MNVVTEKYSAADMDELLDREAIRDVVARYCHAIDRCDDELLRNCYWPEGKDNHGFYNGGRDGYVTWVMAALRANATLTRHTTSPSLIRIDGNTAKVETYFNSYMRSGKPGTSASEVNQQGGRYLDHMEKRGKEWRILERWVVYDFDSIQPDSSDILTSKYGSPDLVTGRRKADGDAASKLFGETLGRSAFTRR